MASIWGNLLTNVVVGARKRPDPQGWGYKPPSQSLSQRAAQTDNPFTERGYDDKAYNEWKKSLEAQGYETGARPYEFDVRAFQDPNYQANKDLFQQAMAQRQGVQAPLVGMGNQFRDYQTSLAQQLQQQALGQGDSIAQNQLRQGIERAIAAQRATAAASNNPLLAARNAARQAGDLQAGLAGQSALLRLQEQQGAQQQLAGLAEAARGGDIGVEELNMKSMLAEQAMQDEMTRYYTTLGYTNDQAQFQARKDLEAMRAQQHSAAQETAVPYNVSSGGGGFNAGGAMGGAGTLLAGLGALFSDIRMKENIMPIGMQGSAFAKQQSLVDMMDDMVTQGINPEVAATQARSKVFGGGKGFNFFANQLGGGLFSDKNVKDNVKQGSQLRDYMNKLEGYTYNYKGADPKDRWAGVMAQDMEKSKLGKTAVMDVNGFKAIDGKRALSLSLASIAELNKRLNKLEGRKGA